MTPVVAHLHALFTDWGVGSWALFVAEVAVSGWVLWLCVRWTLAPGEDAPDHVKRSILGDDGGVIVVSIGDAGRGPLAAPPAPTTPPARSPRRPS